MPGVVAPSAGSRCAALLGGPPTAPAGAGYFGDPPATPAGAGFFGDPPATPAGAGFGPVAPRLTLAWLAGLDGLDEDVSAGSDTLVGGAGADRQEYNPPQGPRDSWNWTEEARRDAYDKELANLRDEFGPGWEQEAAFFNDYGLRPDLAKASTREAFVSAGLNPDDYGRLPDFTRELWRAETVAAGLDPDGAQTTSTYDFDLNPNPTAADTAAYSLRGRGMSRPHDKYTITFADVAANWGARGWRRAIAGAAPSPNDMEIEGTDQRKENFEATVAFRKAWGLRELTKEERRLAMHQRPPGFPNYAGGNWYDVFENEAERHEWERTVEALGEATRATQDNQYQDWEAYQDWEREVEALGRDTDAVVTADEFQNLPEPPPPPAADDAFDRAWDQYGEDGGGDGGAGETTSGSRGAAGDEGAGGGFDDWGGGPGGVGW